MRSVSIICGLVLLASSALQVALADEAIPVGKLPEDATPLAYSLKLKIDPREERFNGQVGIRVKLSKAADHLWLHGQDLDVNKVQLIDAAGKAHKATYAAQKEGVAKVTFDGTLPAQDVELVFDYSAAFNAKLEGLYKVKVGDDAYAVTQMEAISARNAFPGFDEPRFKTPFDITLTVPKAEVAVANTIPKREETSANGKWKTIVYATTKPLPTYLVAVAVGPWDVVDAAPMPANDIRKNPVPLRAIGPRGTGSQLHWILEQTPAIVKYYEEYTNQPYPFDKLDLLGAPDFGAGAMENAGLIVFRDALLRLDAQSPADLYRSSFDVTAHEIAHQWFGDLVTVPWWDDIWLNEAFATWAQGKATVALKPEYHGDLGRLEGALGAMRSDSLLSARKIRQPIAGQGDIENAFDGITYQKGAAVLRMFEEWLGEDTYRKAMRAYLARHAFGSGNSDDLVATIAEVSGKGETLKTAMRSLLDQPGIPLVHAGLACGNGKATLALVQSRYLPFGVLGKQGSGWSIPVCARFGHADKSARQCFLLDKPQQTFAADGGCADWYLPNADAAGYYRFTMADADFAALGRHIGTLTAPEQMVYADAVSSGFHRGDVLPATVLGAMPALASADMPQVATALLRDFAWIRRHLATDATRPALDAYAIALYGPRLKALGLKRRPDDAAATINLRVRLAEFLALTVRDPDVRKALNAQGRAVLGLDAGIKVDLEHADPDLLRTVLMVTVQESGTPAFDAVLGELGRNHQTAQRYEMLAALGATRDPVLGDRARDYALTPAVQLGEMSRLYGANIEEPENRAAYWTWFQAHYEALKARMSPLARGHLPAMPANGRCSGSEADELRNFFEPRIKDLTGGERILAQSLETITQCNSLREHVGEKSLATWAEAHPAR
ncbi:MAG: M1 family aminopeptidase [Rudaea sp.]|nr:M1 family aminopeptidase [Rudaea sp.]